MASPASSPSPSFKSASQPGKLTLTVTPTGCQVGLPGDAHRCHQRCPIDKRSVINEARDLPLYLKESLLGERFADPGFITIVPVTKVTTIRSTKNEPTSSQAPIAPATTPAGAPPRDPIAPGQSKPERFPSTNVCC